MEHWDKIIAVQRMQDYIDTHINDPITLSALAQSAGYSPWHASKLFKEIVGKNPFDYIRAVRLSTAASRLLDRKERIVDVAFDFVFDSHDGFTRAFTKQFGMTPAQYRKSRSALKLFLPTPAVHQYVRQQKGEIDMTKKPETVFVQVVDRPERKLILKRGKKATHYFEYCEEVGCDIWDVLSEIKEALYEPIGMWLPDGLVTPGTSVYAQGVEVPADFSGQVPEGFDIIQLKPCKLMVFQGPPYEDEAFESAISDLWEVMKQYDPGFYGFKWADEDAPRFQLIPLGYRGYIEARPVRLINE